MVAECYTHYRPCCSHHTRPLISAVIIKEALAANGKKKKKMHQFLSFKLPSFSGFSCGCLFLPFAFSCFYFFSSLCLVLVFSSSYPRFLLHHRPSPFSFLLSGIPRRWAGVRRSSGADEAAVAAVTYTLGSAHSSCLVNTAGAASR